MEFDCAEAVRAGCNCTGVWVQFNKLEQDVGAGVAPSLRVPPHRVRMGKRRRGRKSPNGLIISLKCAHQSASMDVWIVARMPRLASVEGAQGSRIEPVFLEPP
jgi:hypothetical protein